MERAANMRQSEKTRRQFSLFNIKAGGVDLTFLILVLLLLTIGLIMLFSASYAYAYYNRGNSFAFISNQLVYAVIGVVLMLLLRSAAGPLRRCGPGSTRRPSARREDHVWRGRRWRRPGRVR